MASEPSLVHPYPQHILSALTVTAGLRCQSPVLKPVHLQSTHKLKWPRSPLPDSATQRHHPHTREEEEACDLDCVQAKVADVEEALGGPEDSLVWVCSVLSPLHAVFSSRTRYWG